jgi:hypothetical protein
MAYRARAPRPRSPRSSQRWGEPTTGRRGTGEAASQRGRVRDGRLPEPSGCRLTGELLEIERLTSSSERGGWKSACPGNSSAAYSTSRPDLRDIMPPLSQSLDPIDPHRRGRWDQDSSTDDRLARRGFVHRLALSRGRPEPPQPLPFPPIGPDHPETARRDLAGADPAAQGPVPQLVR